MILQKGKLNVGPLDASHGSSGKSKIADYIAVNEHLDFAISHNSFNASHITVFDDGTQYKFNFLPSSVAKGGLKVVVGADAVINPEKALEEIKDWGLTEKNLFLHPLIAIIEPKDAEWEMENLAYMGSTMTGGGKAKADKVTRTKGLFVRDHPKLKKYVANTHELVNSWLARGETGLLETAQGYDLSQDTIWTGRDGQVKTMYPFNTSRNINPSSFLGFSFVSPRFAGTTILNIRSYGIRVGDSSTASGDFVVKMQDGSEAGLLFSEFGVSAVPPLDQVKSKYPGAIGIVKLGSSGPVYDDQEELSWGEITRRSGSPTPISEKTSLTLRTRRVFDRSLLQIRNSTMACAPNAISINFANYLEAKIYGVRGKISRAELMAQWPKVAEFVSWVEENQYWAGTSHAGRVVLLGTGPKRSEMLELGE